MDVKESMNTIIAIIKNKEKFHEGVKILSFFFFSVAFEKWNTIPHYTQTEIKGRGPCEPSLTR